MKLITNAMTGACLRVVEKDGEPWFVAKDVCNALRIEQTGRALEKLDEDEKGVNPIHTLGGVQKMWIVSESGLYALILRSNKAEARVFRRWVTGEVLPEIRRTGRYGGHGWEVELGRLEREVMEAQGRLDAFRAELAVRLGIGGQESGVRGQLKIGYGKAAVGRVRVDYEGLASDMPLPSAMVGVVQWMMRERGQKQDAARQRIYRMLKAGLLVRLADGRIDRKKEEF
jgi:prophage antirepressor-like protein